MVSKLLTFITGRLNPGIIESTHGLNQAIKREIKQARRPDFYKYIGRWIDLPELSINCTFIVFKGDFLHANGSL